MVNIASPANHQDEIARLDLRIMVIKQRLKATRNLSSTDLHHCRHEIVRAIKDCKRLFGPDHVSTIDLRMDLAMVLTRTTRSEEALPHWRKALTYHETSGDREALQTCVRNYAECLNRVHRFEAALPYWERALSGENERKPGAMNFIRLGMANALINAGRPLEALEQLNLALVFYQKQQAAGVWMIGFARCLNYIARVYEQIGKMEEARDALRYSIIVRENSPNPKARGILVCKLLLVRNLIADGKLDKAMEERAQAEQMAVDRMGPGHWLTRAFRESGSVPQPADTIDEE